MKDIGSCGEFVFAIFMKGAGHAKASAHANFKEIFRRQFFSLQPFQPGLPLLPQKEF